MTHPGNGARTGSLNARTSIGSWRDAPE